MRRALLREGCRPPASRIGLTVRTLGCCMLAASLLVAGGCTSGGRALLATATHMYGGASAEASPPPRNSQLNYLRAHLGQREVYLALGYVDPLPEGPTEVWYSGSGEVLRIRQGRIVGTTGLTTDWRAVRFAAQPSWAALASRPDTPVRFTRERDLMPGYRFGVRDEVRIAAIAPPARSRMAQQHAAPVQWFEERSTTVPARDALPPARFAVTRVDDGGEPQVVYSEQCLTRDLCLSLERWKPAPAGEAAAAAGS